jgi:carboxylesterase
VIAPELNSPFFIGPEDAERACLLIHGFSGRPSEMRGLGEALAAQGIRVYGVLLAGHSGDPEHLLHSNRKQWIASAEEGLAQLARYPQVFVAGLSMGGVLSLLLASRHPERIAGVAALSTPTRNIGGWQGRAVPVARYFMRWFYPLAQLNFNDPKVQAQVLKQARLRDPAVDIDFSDAQTVAMIKQMIRIPVPAIAELFALTNQTRKQLGRVRSPLLIIQSKNDQTVNPACAEELYRLTTAAVPRSLHWLERSDHVITMGVEREEVYRLVIEFLSARYMER